MINIRYTRVSSHGAQSYGATRRPNRVNTSVCSCSPLFTLIHIIPRIATLTSGYRARLALLVDHCVKLRWSPNFGQWRLICAFSLNNWRCHAANKITSEVRVRSAVYGGFANAKPPTFWIILGFCLGFPKSLNTALQTTRRLLFWVTTGYQPDQPNTCFIGRNNDKSNVECYTHVTLLLQLLLLLIGEWLL